MADGSTPGSPKKTAPQRSYDVIQTSIRNGTFRPGEFLREEQLAQIVGVSRTPIREALRRLSAEGLVIVTPNRGAQVVTWSREDVDIIFALRLRLEGYAARLAAEKIDANGVSSLTSAATRMEDLLPAWRSNIEEITRLNVEFHEGVIKACRSPLLAASTASVVQLALVIHTYRSFSDADMSRSIQQHHELVSALASHSPDWAESVMRAHLLAAKSVLLRTESEVFINDGSTPTPADLGQSDGGSDEAPNES